MNNSVSRFSLDLERQDSQVYVTVRQGDTVKKLSAMLKERGTPYSITDGTTATLAAKKSNGTDINAACTIEDNRILVVLPAEFTEAAGKLNACFILSGSEAALTSPPFTILVDPKAASIISESSQEE